MKQWLAPESSSHSIALRVPRGNRSRPMWPDRPRWHRILSPVASHREASPRRLARPLRRSLTFTLRFSAWFLLCILSYLLYYICYSPYSAISSWDVQNSSEGRTEGKGTFNIYLSMGLPKHVYDVGAGVMACPALGPGLQLNSTPVPGDNSCPTGGAP
jgi:hypothetical protein